MYITEKIDGFLNESPKLKKQIISKIDKARRKKRDKALSAFVQIEKEIDTAFSNGDLTAQEADNLKTEIKDWDEAISWRGSYR